MLVQKLIQEMIFKFLKNYFSLEKICNKNSIELNIRNSLLVYYYFSENKRKTLKEVYEGKYSIQPEDEKIYNTAINLKNKVLPSFPNWLEKN